MSRVAVVTDSTSYLPDGVAGAHGITVVPLHVVLGAITGTENVDLSPADVAKALHERRVHVSTSRPTPAELEAAYRARGAQQIVSVHLSGRLSGTSDSARLAGAGGRRGRHRGARRRQRLDRDGAWLPGHRCG